MFGLSPGAVVRAPPWGEQVARAQVGSGPVEERPGIVDHPRRRSRIPQHPVQARHEHGHPGAPPRCPGIPGQHVEHHRRHAPGRGGDDVLGDHRVVSPGQLGRSRGMGSRAQDVAHLGRRGQRMQVGGRGGIPGGGRGMAGRRIGGLLRRPVGRARGRTLPAGARRTVGEDLGGVEGRCRARVVRVDLGEDDQCGLGARRGIAGDRAQLVHRQVDVPGGGVHPRQSRTAYDRSGPLRGGK